MVQRISQDEFTKVCAFLFEKPKAENRKPLAIAVTDQAANLVFLEHMDGIHSRGGSIASAKAFTAARMHRTTLNLRQYCEDTHTELAAFGCSGLTNMPGGSPIYDKNGELIGAVGISGWSAAEDQMLADACAEFIGALRA